jgi:hypothetical protein
VTGVPASNSIILSHPEQFDAARIYQTNNISVIDPLVRNLAIIIPDSVGTNRSSLWPTFLPANATIAEGMRVFWFNSDVNATHSIVVRNASGGIISSASVPYHNATVYRFGHEGTYTFSDPSVPDLKNGTINVVRPQSFSADAFNSSSGTMGVFAVPAAAKPQFDLHFHKLGFNIVSTYNFAGFPGNAVNNGTGPTSSGPPAASGAKVLYVWTQEVSGMHTAITRVDSKIRLLEDIIYPHGMVKVP